MMCPNWRTKQGFEMQFGVNHLGKKWLINLCYNIINNNVEMSILLLFMVF